MNKTQTTEEKGQKTGRGTERGRIKQFQSLEQTKQVTTQVLSRT